MSGDASRLMGLRSLVGIVAGFAVWWFLFFALGIGFGLLWPAYREAARVMFSESDLSQYTTPMLLMNWVLFLVAGLAAGWLASSTAKNRSAGLVVATLFLLMMGFNHYVAVWDELPAWYNASVPLVIAGSVALGTRLYKAI